MFYVLYVQTFFAIKLLFLVDRPQNKRGQVLKLKDKRGKK